MGGKSTYDGIYLCKPLTAKKLKIEVCANAYRNQMKMLTLSGKNIHEAVLLKKNLMKQLQCDVVQGLSFS